MNLGITASLVLALLIALALGACAPKEKESTLANPEAPEEIVIPVTGEQPAESALREPQDPRRWSGEVSDNNQNPDLNTATGAEQNAGMECSSEDDPVRRQGGCIE